MGFGSAVILLPICSYVLGPEQAVPVLTVAGLMGNLARAAFSCRDTDWPAVAVYSAGAVPTAALGAFVFVQLDAALMQRLLGVLIVAIVPARRWATARSIRVRRWHLMLVGAAMGFLSGVVGTTGPINAPFFLSCGLLKGAYLSTEALATSSVHITKMLVYRRFGALTAVTATTGLSIGCALVLGSYLGRRLVDRLEAEAFQRWVEVFLIGSGVLMILGIR